MTTDIVNTPFHDPSDIAFVRDAARPILTHGRVLSAGGAMRPHSHPRSQLLWALRGVLRVVSGPSVWVVPPSHAVWIPGDVPHQVFIETEAEMLNLYLDDSLAVRQGTGAHQSCAVVLLTPLMRELIRRIGGMDTSGPFDPRLLRLCAVVLDELEALPEAALSLPGAQDARLQRVTRHLVAQPGDQRPLAELAALAGVSPRTLERLFRTETGLNFRQWRSRLRLLSAIEGLNAGQSSTTIAFSLGYRSPSAFVAAFREEFGTTPQRFLKGG